MTDADAAYLCYASYYRPAMFGRTSKVANVATCITGNTIVFPGTENVMDAARDIESVILTTDPILGPIGGGFIQGMRECVSAFVTRLSLGKYIQIYGHSLGAARAMLAAAILVTEHKVDPRLIDLVAFGCPCPGGQQLAKILEPVPARSYCNGHDIVCSVLTIDPEFLHPKPLTKIYCAPLAGDEWGVARYHHIQLYLAAMAIK